MATITFAALLAAASFRSSTGALIEPLEAEFGWSRSLTSAAITVNFALYGVTAPFAAALMSRLGVRGVVVAALALIAAGMGLSTLMVSGWQLYALWGLFVGVGTGSVALVLGAIVANRWFVKHRGLMIGVFSAASATGQLVALPVVATLTEHMGWRQAALLIAATALALIPFVLALLAESPAAVGLRPVTTQPPGTPPACCVCSLPSRCCGSPGRQNLPLLLKLPRPRSTSPRWPDRLSRRVNHLAEACPPHR